MALALALVAAAVLLWVLNPYAALLAVPAAHLWTLTALTRPAPPRRARALLVALGALPGALVWLYYLFALSLDPLESLWYLLLLVTGHTLGLATALIGCLWLGAARRGDRAHAADAEGATGGREARGAAGVRAGPLRGARLARRHGVGAAPLNSRPRRLARLAHRPAPCR